MDYAQAIIDRKKLNPNADVSDLEKKRADKMAGKGSEGQEYFKSYSQADREKHASTPVQKKNPTVPGQKSVEISSNKYPNGRILNSLDDAETDAERSIFLGSQGLIKADTNQYAYVDEYGFEHVASLGSALAYGKPGTIQKYNGFQRGGYARTEDGKRAMIGLDGSRNYGNAPLDDEGNPIRYQAVGSVEGPKYDINSYLDNFSTTAQAKTNPVYTPPNEREETTAISELKAAAKGFGAMALYAKRQLTKMGISW